MDGLLSQDWAQDCFRNSTKDCASILVASDDVINRLLTMSTCHMGTPIPSIESGKMESHITYDQPSAQRTLGKK